MGREELQVAFKSEKIMHYFAVLEIDIDDSNYLFDMLDMDRSGEVDMDEFVSGCMRLKGSAKGIDIHTLMLMVNKMNTKMDLLLLEGVAEAQRHQLEMAIAPDRSSRILSSQC